MKERRTLTEAAALMERQQTSGLTVQAFCSAENINTATYYYWRKQLRLRENPETSRLIPVCIEKTRPQHEPDKVGFAFTYPNGVRLSVPLGCELSLIRELVFIL